ncbi:hypothetical protein M977_04735 [Buttiauxella gaviniae ATCC 51604]|uniref:Uncharacterized protein n=1 Tax=Buttiauxella gaviniae ATCC 51604 TaxID=1354253 RepID=A0A1B7HHR7_9ENTR|nr:hypothetical protein [Buttiauxella gaviniae]OAT15127.1 hypothetical protein M977_04735 [Buttiauxella gaviniae ATCC 51604]
MISEISASVTAIKTSLDLLRVLGDAKSESEIQAATHGLHRQLTDLQIENLRLAQLLSSQYEEITSLKRELSKADKEKREFERYTEYKTGAGHFIYAVRDSLDNDGTGEPYACPHCYHKGAISFLQALYTDKNDIFHKAKCPSCSNVFRMEKNEDRVTPQTMSDIGKLMGGGSFS